jgi:hypothetical protein
MATQQWLQDNGMAPRPRMSSMAQNTFEMAVAEAGRASRQMQLERDMRSVAERQLRKKSLAVEAAFVEVEQAKRLANDERLLRETAHSELKQRTCAMTTLASAATSAQQKLKEERAERELLERESKRKTEIAEFAVVETETTRRQLQEERSCRLAAEIAADRKCEAADVALSERDEWRRIAEKEVELRQAAEVEAKQSREAADKAMQYADWVERQSEEDRIRSLESVANAQLKVDAAVSAEARARRDGAEAWALASEQRALREVLEAELARKTDSTDSMAAKFEMEKRQAAEARAVLVDSAEQARQRAEAASAAEAEVRRQLVGAEDELVALRAATEVEMTEQARIKAMIDADAMQLKRVISEMEEEMKAARAAAEAAREKQVQARKAAETARLEMAARLQVAVDEATAAKWNEERARLAASRDVVAARFEAIAEASAKLDAITSEKAATRMYAKEVVDITSGSRVSSPGRLVGRWSGRLDSKATDAARKETSAAMARIDDALAVAKSRRQAEASRYAKEAMHIGMPPSPELSQSLARSHQLQEEMEETFRRHPVTPSPLAAASLRIRASTASTPIVSSPF